MSEVIAIEPEPRSWAVKHNGGFLGRTGTREEALAVARALVQWISEQGRPVEVIEEPGDRQGGGWRRAQAGESFRLTNTTD